MKFIEERTLPSQKKRNVLGTTGEVERLLTILWHMLLRVPTYPALCVCDEDPTGTKLLPTGIPENFYNPTSPA